MNAPTISSIQAFSYTPPATSLYCTAQILIFKFVKTAGMCSMRHSHQDVESTWNTTWFSTFRRQRVSSTATATNATFVNRILQRGAVAQQGGPCTAKASPCPRFYNYDLKQNQRSIIHRCPELIRDKLASSTVLLSEILSLVFSFFSFYTMLVHFFLSPPPRGNWI